LPLLPQHPVPQQHLVVKPLFVADNLDGTQSVGLEVVAPARRSAARAALCSHQWHPLLQQQLLASKTAKSSCCGGRQAGSWVGHWHKQVALT
jgi:hypothetical protein